MSTIILTVYVCGAIVGSVLGAWAADQARMWQSLRGHVENVRRTTGQR